MIHGNLKKALRLNRTLGWCFLLYSAIFFGLSLSNELAGNGQLSNALFLAVTLGFLIGNQLFLHLVKKIPEHDDLAVEKFCVFLPIITLGVIGLAYLFSGNLFVFMFMPVALLQSQLFGHYRLSKVLFACSIGVYLIGTLFGHPHVWVSNPHISYQVISILMVTPLALAYFHYGSFVATLVRSTSNQVTKLQSLASTDGLTGLINRRQFNHRLQSEISRGRRHATPLTLALFDIDNFKRLNDFYGHPVGDRILIELGGLISQNVRESDIPARYGGEEFALILPETRQVEAYELLERLRALVEKTVFCLPDNPLTITISVGVAEFNPKQHTAFELVEQADAALYEAKRQGKNRVVYGVVPTPKIQIPPPPSLKPYGQ